MTILHSLRFRLILVLILVTLVPVATVSILMLQATEKAFRSYSHATSAAHPGPGGPGRELMPWPPDSMIRAPFTSRVSKRTGR